jgi:hypothetical protein
MGSNKECKCGYQVRVGKDQVTLTAQQMKDLVSDINVFFNAEGYPSMTNTDMKDEMDEFRIPLCFGEYRGCRVAHCVHAKECLDAQKAPREQNDHEAAEIHDMQMAALFW